MAHTAVILTGSELRHRFVRKALAGLGDIRVVASVCEDLTGSVVDRVSRSGDGSSAEAMHLVARAQCEEDFFGWFDRMAVDQSNPRQIPRGSINQPEIVEWVRGKSPDLIISYGCSILRDPFLAAFPDRILNVHLGLSPYYRGGATNFWPLVNGSPELVGVTFMKIDAGIDTGPIIHQMRARILPHDNVHQIGNRLISDIVPVLSKLARHYETLPPMSQPHSMSGKEYRMKDFTAESVERIYANFDNGLVADYLRMKAEREQATPIVENPAVHA